MISRRPSGRCERTALINQLRAILLERAEWWSPQGCRKVKHFLSVLMDEQG